MTDEPTQLDQFRAIALTGFAIVAVVAIGALIREGSRQYDAGAGYDLLNQKGIAP